MGQSHLISGVLVGALLTLAVLLILFGLPGSFEGVISSKGHVQEIELGDECGMIMGNVMHTIPDDPNCRIKCRAYCSSKKLEYVNSVFNGDGNPCFSCKCLCD